MAGLVVDAPRELRYVLGPGDAVADELRRARDARERRLELVRHVRGELPAHEVCAPKLRHLGLERALLLGDALHERHDLHVRRAGVRRVYVEHRLDKPGGHDARNQPARNEDHEDHEDHEHHVVRDGGHRRVTIDREAHDAAVIQAHGAIDAHHALRGALALSRALAIVRGLLHLGAPGMVAHVVNVALVVVEDGAVLVDEGEAYLAHVEVHEPHDVAVGPVAAQHGPHDLALALEHAPGVVYGRALEHKGGDHQNHDGRHR